MRQMRHWLNPILTLLLVLSIPLLLAAKGDAEAGKAIYAKRCAACHAKEGEGKPAIAKMLKVELRHLGSKEVQARSDDEIRKLLTEGKGKKKPVKGLSNEDMVNVIAYVRTLAKK